MIRVTKGNFNTLTASHKKVCVEKEGERIALTDAHWLFTGRVASEFIAHILPAATLKDGRFIFEKVGTRWELTSESGPAVFDLIDRETRNLEQRDTEVLTDTKLSYEDGVALSIMATKAEYVLVQTSFIRPMNDILSTMGGRIEMKYAGDYTPIGIMRGGELVAILMPVRIDKHPKAFDYLLPRSVEEKTQKTA
jgi:hypothetical protein